MCLGRIDIPHKVMKYNSDDFHHGQARYIEYCTIPDREPSSTNVIMTSVLMTVN